MFGEGGLGRWPESLGIGMGRKGKESGKGRREGEGKLKGVNLGACKGWFWHGTCMGRTVANGRHHKEKDSGLWIPFLFRLHQGCRCFIVTTWLMQSRITR